MTQDNYCIPCGLVSEVCSEGAIVLPSERVLSGSEGRLLYGPEFFLGISNEVFDNDVFFLGIEISDTCLIATGSSSWASPPLQCSRSESALAPSEL